MRSHHYEKAPLSDASFYNNVAICAQFQDVVGGSDQIEESRFTQTSEDLALFLSQPAYGIGKTVRRIYEERLLDSDP